MRRVWRWWRTGDGKALLALLVVSCIVRLPLMPFRGFYDDLGLYTLWGVEAQTQLLHVYSFGAATTLVPSNYPPLTIYLYGALVWIYDHTIHPLPLLGGNGFQSYVLGPYPGLVWLLKVPVLLGDLGLLALLYRLGRRVHSPRYAFIAAATYAICPAVLIAGILWGQLDGVATCLVLLALVLALEEHEIGAGIALALAVLVKPQPAIFIPLLLVYLWRWRGRAQTIRAVGAMGGTALILCAIYLLPPHPELFALYNNVQFSLRNPPATSIDAYNLWTVLGVSAHPVSTPFLGPLTTGLIGWGLFGGVLLLVCIGIWLDGSPRRLLLGAGIVAATFFDVAVLQHERYLYPALALFFAAGLCARRGWPAYGLYALSALTLTLNLIATAVPIAVNMSYQTPIAALNLLILLGALMYFGATLDIGSRRSEKPAKEIRSVDGMAAESPLLT